MMSKEILITRPNYDYTTRYISAWAKKVIEFAKSKGYTVLDLKEKRAIKKEFESMISKRNPSGIMLNGHGSESAIAGHDGELLVEAGNNERFLSGKIVYALSCRSARKLGQASIVTGTRAYLGYTEDFIFMYSNEKRTHPMEDKTVALFLEPSNQVVISLLKGWDALTAHKNSRKAFARTMQKLLTSQTRLEDSATLRYLYWDMTHQVCLGDGSACL